MTSEADPREPEEVETSGSVASQAKEIARLTPTFAGVSYQKLDEMGSVRANVLKLQ